MPVNERLALDAKRFFERYLRHTKGRYANSPFLLEDWQWRDVIRPVFGTVRDDGYRQYQQVLLGVGRKNGKSELGAGVALKMLTADREPSAEVYSAAGDREQAANVYDVAEQMVRLSRALDKRCKITTSKRNISVPRTGSKYRVVSADGGRQHGLNPSAVIFDEVHVQRRRALWNAMTTGSDTRAQPLIFAITTCGVPDESPVWWDLHEYARQLREGIFEDPTFLSIHYGADLKDDFDDPKVWKKANPALGSFLSMEKFKAAWQRARRMKSEWNDFLRYRLNVPVQQVDRWIAIDQWDACKAPIDWNALRGEPCYVGIDLSSRLDITAMVLAFPRDNGRFLLRPYFWLPKDNLPKRLEAWQAEGLIETTHGNTIDYEALRLRLKEISDAYDLREIHMDDWGISQLATELQKDGYKVSATKFNMTNLTGPSKDFESMIPEGRIQHDGNKVLRWMADCVGIQSDPLGRIMPSKPDRLKSEKRIDGIVATIYALMVASTYNGEDSYPIIRSVG